MKRMARGTATALPRQSRRCSPSQATGTLLQRNLVLLIVANLLIVVALLWAASERLSVRVIVANGEVSGRVGGTTVTAPFDGAVTGKIGFFLQGADAHAPISWPTETTGQLPSPGLSDGLYRLAAESAWANIRVIGSDGQILYSSASSNIASERISRLGDWFHHPFGGQATAIPGLLTIGSSDWHAYQITADLLRPRNAAGILVLSPDGANGLLFYFRPEDRDVDWYVVENGQWKGPVAHSDYR